MFKLSYGSFVVKKMNDQQGKINSLLNVRVVGVRFANEMDGTNVC